jgi:pyruvate dehydrogenase (quinone)/pyruvate oxidase
VVVDPNEPPLPAKITPDPAKALGEPLARGEEHRRRIGLTIGRQLIDERTFAASPYGVAERVKEKVTGALTNDGGEN